MLVVLTGGTGGAKLIHGLNYAIKPEELFIICNTADDFVVHGLHVSPDLDTVTYTLAGMADLIRGWGIEDDTFKGLDALAKLGSETWFKLGDRDLATHIVRTSLLHEGLPLSQVTRRICRTLGVEATIAPMSDETVETVIETPQKDLSFQEYFVKHRWADEVKGVRLAGIEKARPAPGILDSLMKAEAIIVCPSNPVTSIGPILAVPGLRDALRQTRAPVIGVSPIIQDTPFSGPAHRLMAAMDMEVSAFGVAAAYKDFLDTLVIDEKDEISAPRIETLKIKTVTAPIRMDSLADKTRLAKTVLTLCGGALST